MEINPRHVVVYAFDVPSIHHDIVPWISYVRDAYSREPTRGIKAAYFEINQDAQVKAILQFRSADGLGDCAEDIKEKVSIVIPESSASIYCWYHVASLGQEEDEDDEVMVPNFNPSNSSKKEYWIYDGLSVAVL